MEIFFNSFSKFQRTLVHNLLRLERQIDESGDYGDIACCLLCTKGFSSRRLRTRPDLFNASAAQPGEPLFGERRANRTKGRKEHLLFDPRRAAEDGEEHLLVIHEGRSDYGRKTRRIRRDLWPRFCPAMDPRRAAEDGDTNDHFCPPQASCYGHPVKHEPIRLGGKTDVGRQRLVDHSARRSDPLRPISFPVVIRPLVADRFRQLPAS